MSFQQMFVDSRRSGRDDLLFYIVHDHNEDKDDIEERLQDITKVHVHVYIIFIWVMSSDVCVCVCDVIAFRMFCAPRDLM